MLQLIIIYFLHIQFIHNTHRSNIFDFLFMWFVNPSMQPNTTRGGHVQHARVSKTMKWTKRNLVVTLKVKITNNKHHIINQIPNNAHIPVHLYAITSTHLSQIYPLTYLLLFLSFKILKKHDHYIRISLKSNETKSMI